MSSPSPRSSSFVTGLRGFGAALAGRGTAFLRRWPAMVRSGRDKFSITVSCLDLEIHIFQC